MQLPLVHRCTLSPSKITSGPHLPSFSHQSLHTCTHLHTHTFCYMIPVGDNSQSIAFTFQQCSPPIKDALQISRVQVTIFVIKWKGLSNSNTEVWGHSFMQTQIWPSHGSFALTAAILSYILAFAWGPSGAVLSLQAACLHCHLESGSGTQQQQWRAVKTFSYRSQSERHRPISGSW